MSKAATIVVSDVDLFRLRRALRGVHPTAKKLLEAGLAGARVVPSARVPADVVTMHARVTFEECCEECCAQRRDGRPTRARGSVDRLRRCVVIVYPSEADPAKGLVSVLSPIGSALLGLAVGAVFTWPLATGGSARFRVIDVLSPG